MKLLFDFDGTITQKDTISTLAQSAINVHKERDGIDLNDTWSQIVKAYMDDLKECQEGYEPAEDDRHSMEEEARYLECSLGLELASLKRVNKSGIFKGLSRDDLFNMGVEARRTGAVSIREGFETVAALAESKGWRTGVLSVNWSRAFIEGVIHPVTMEVIANDVNLEGTIEGPGGPLTNSRGKVSALHSYGFKQQGEDAPESRTIYFGDSPTDLESLALLGGVAISSQEEDTALIKSLRRIGMTVPHISCGSDQWEHKVYWARDFAEIERCGVLGGSNE